MWDKIKLVIVTVLATLGVLFIIIMLIPDDEDEPEGFEKRTTLEEAVAHAEAVEHESPGESRPGEEEPHKEEDEETVSPEEGDTEENDDGKKDREDNTAVVNIPASEVSDKAIRFSTTSLDGEKVTQDVFSDYDITVVFLWGTYCGSCIAEMGNYAEFYRDLPDNVNLIGNVCDVYDGLNSNKDAAEEILSEAGAEFMNLRTSDSILDVTRSLQLIPSAFFVDREGHIVGEMLEGAGFTEMKSRLSEYIE